MAAVVLPVPVGATSAAASDRRFTPVDRPPELARPNDPRDDYAPDDFGVFGADAYGVDDYLAEPPAGGSLARRGRAGHPGAPARLPDLPDRFPGLPYGLPGLSDHPHHHPGGPPGRGRWHHHRHHPFGPDFPGPPYSAPYPGSGSEGAGRHRPSRPSGPSDTDRAHRPPGGGRAPSSRRAAPSAPPVTTPARPSSPSRYVADRLTRRSYEKLPPLPTPDAPKKEPRSAPGNADGESAATESPYAMESPTAPVERVLPMGAGLALTGLGLAFFGLRLRRR
ncbi:hypothetical protein DY245_16965 [Streptomyces inhibens]|uniref:Uncharacterized protein n=1 Tax=Streptomyces inhibens TaxID=2293571 RepID=A0A371Q3I3_STRIH|nr:hypothetical protein DY245_16965 [Streptomyces inhibens]